MHDKNYQRRWRSPTERSPSSTGCIANNTKVNTSCKSSSQYININSYPHIPPSRSADNVLNSSGVYSESSAVSSSNNLSDSDVSYMRQHGAPTLYNNISSNGYGAPTTRRRHLHPTQEALRPVGSTFTDPSYANSSPRSNISSSPKSHKISNTFPIPIAILLWYLLGVISIATSKILLSNNNVPPLVLTVQQLIVGMTFLRLLLELQTSGDVEKDVQFRRGVQPVPIQHRDSSNDNSMMSSSPEKCESGMQNKVSQSKATNNMGLLKSLYALMNSSIPTYIHNQLFLAAIYFAFGFLLTNIGFKSGSAAFVETIKAAEPFTSASVAVLWGIEKLGYEEVMSLIGIVIGVVLSTLGNGSAATGSSDIMMKCCIVMLSNLCFSFRGLHQKLFRSTPQGNASMIDDLNLQYRMQQIGIVLLIIPAAVVVLQSTLFSEFKHNGGSTIKHALYYISISLINGLAFTSYNLASTYVLTRISVVHHAALNCIRRVFAIIVTSLIFGLSITILQVVGIGLAVVAFFCYIHFKMKKETKDKKKKELRKKWGGMMMNGKKGSLLPG